VTSARVVRAAGALVEVAPLPQAALYEIVRVGQRRLLGEVIRVQGETATVQVFEDTTGLALEEPVEATGAPLQAELGPGLLGSVLDGTGRPLSRLADQEGNFLSTGTVAPTLDRSRRWVFTPSAKVGDRMAAGDELGTVEENEGITHKILVPPASSGVLAEIAAGTYAVDEPFGRLEDGTILT
jgi:V/A-type H+-transporting ATPase subunit A